MQRRNTTSRPRENKKREKREKQRLARLVAPPYRSRREPETRPGGRCGRGGGKPPPRRRPRRGSAVPSKSTTDLHPLAPSAPRLARGPRGTEPELGSIARPRPRNGPRVLLYSVSARYIDARRTPPSFTSGHFIFHGGGKEVPPKWFSFVFRSYSSPHSPPGASRPWLPLVQGAPIRAAAIMRRRKLITLEEEKKKKDSAGGQTTRPLFAVTRMRPRERREQVRSQLCGPLPRFPFSRCIGSVLIERHG